MPSSNINRIRDPVSTFSQQVNNEAGDRVRDDEGRQTDIPGTELIRDGRASYGAEVPNHTHSDSEQPLQLGKARGRKLLTNELIGVCFERHMNDILEWLRNDKASIIGIYAMVGAGKTELAKHINNKLIETPSTFNWVYWVTASSDFSIPKLQNSIARAADVKLSSLDDENIKAAKLAEALTKNGKSILILDDVWDYIPLDKVGIPVGMKLVLTTYSLDVCRKFSCQENVKIGPLTTKEAWELFLKELGNETVLNLEIKGIAESIVEECEGLPLEIEMMARNMRGVGDTSEWRNALVNLKGAIQRLENMELFKKLRRSYANLSDSSLQRCFLYCASFLHDYDIEKDALIAYLIVEGIIKEKKSRQEELNEGYTMLNRLEDVCLISYDDDSVLKINRSMRHMAVQLMEESSPAIVKCGEEVEELPDEESWRKDLVRVSLVNTCIKEIPPNLSPRCPNLLTLLLHGNLELRQIPDSFLERMHSLNVLDLSGSGIEKLPLSISHLVNLGALLLSCCRNLKEVPSLAELTGLKKLDLCGSGIEELPQGVELLSNLIYIDLIGTEVEELPRELLRKLCRLQVLNVDVTVEVDDIMCLRKLEALRCCFQNVDELIKWAMSLKGIQQQQQQQLMKYKCIVGEINNCFDYRGQMQIELIGCSISWEAAALVLPGNIDGLAIIDCHVRRRFMLEKATTLRYLKVEKCDGIEYCLLFFFPEDFKASSEGSSSVTVPPLLVLSASNSGTFSHLENIRIIKCPSLKKLFPCWVLSNFQNLEEIKVEDCGSIEEIIVMEETQNYSGIHNNVGSLCLPKLRRFGLIKLPKLKSICSCKLICNSLEYLKIIGCEKLKWMPFSLLDDHHSSPIPSLNIIDISHTEWREGLSWEHPNTFTVLCLSKRFV